ncbi:MAG: hypothetical protein JF886_14245 [Candidatus Dormibacteraeota bacterium]|uniref:Conjugal transfer protein TrbL n=1 Tax=Candidatus Aeolococcus gillhamiae TaxID=3127015 RepID=A0A934JXN4_9BACT|nr:hypothetical protein [Candidatus Dormibacteraeota bacterium]
MRLRLLIAAVIVAGILPLTVTMVRADLTPAQQCGQNNAGHPFGIAAPWDGACWSAALNDVTHFAADSVATTITRWVMSGAVETTDLLLNEFGSGTTTRADFSSPWFQKVYYGATPHNGTAFPNQPGALTIAELLALPLLVMTVIAGVLRGDIGGAVKTVLVRLPLVVILCFAFIVVLQRVFDLVDALSTWVVGGTTTDFQTWASRFDPSNVPADFAVVVICIVIIVATLIAYIELFVRSAMIYLVVAFVPIISVATLWQGSRSALRKTVEFLAVMTLSKLVMAFAFLVGGGALTAGDASSFAPLLVGAVIFAVIAFAPLSLFALIPLVEVAATGAVVGMGARFGGRMVSAGVDRGRGIIGGAPAAVRSLGGSRSQASSAVDAGARLRPSAAGAGAGASPGAGLAVAGWGAGSASSSAPAAGAASAETPREAEAAPAATTGGDTPGGSGNV